jgi:four helix bundle protein
MRDAPEWMLDYALIRRCSREGSVMGSRVSTHKDLDLWQVAIELAVMIYAVTRKLPSSERFGLIAQMRRAAVSVPSNIAEGAARTSTAEFARFLSIARGSLAELETQVALTERLSMCKVESSVHCQITRVRQMLIALQKRLLKSAD